MLPNTLKKMQDFLVLNGQAETFREIKRKPMFIIKEDKYFTSYDRNLDVDIRKNFDSKKLINSVGLKTILPPMKEAVLRVQNDEMTFYYHFKVESCNEKTFDMSIWEYRLKQNVFYSAFHINFKEIDIKDTNYAEVEFKNMKKQMYINTYTETFGMKYLRKKSAISFSKLEKKLIYSEFKQYIKDADEYALMITLDVLSAIGVINFLLEEYKETSPSKFYDNEYFTLKNWTIPE